MGTLADLSEGQKARVVKIKAEGELKRRLFSFGLRRYTDIKIKAISLRKSTIEVEISGGLIALRFEEAQAIEVEAA